MAGWVASTLLTAAGLVYLEVYQNCAIYSLVYALVIPFGAMVSGAVAASGYAVVARMVNYRPGRGMLVCIGGLSGATFFLIYWLKYALTAVNGTPLRQAMLFRRYLAYELAHTAVDLGAIADEPVQLGYAGYAFAALQIAGFALGGLCIYVWLRGLPYCQACSLYMKKGGRQTRYFTRREQMNGCLQAFKAKADAGQFRQAVFLHAGAGSPWRTMARAMHCAWRPWSAVHAGASGWRRGRASG